MVSLLFESFSRRGYWKNGCNLQELGMVGRLRGQRKLYCKKEKKKQKGNKTK